METPSVWSTPHIGRARANMLSPRLVLAVAAAFVMTTSCSDQAASNAPKVRAGASSFSGIGQSPYVPEGYKLAWSDEFDGQNVDRSKWLPQNAGRYFGHTGSLVNADMTYLDGQGHLVVETSYSGNTYMSGQISTKKTYLTRYGYFEARIKMPAKPGKNSAFWIQSPTINRTDGDPADLGTEIDVIEYQMQWNGGFADSALHWGGYGPGRKERKANYRFRFDPGDGWHTYGFLWTADGYRFYLDGRETWRTSVAVSHVPEYLMLSSFAYPNRFIAHPEEVPGGPDDFPDRMLVDYVRVYKAADAPAGGGKSQ